jgi:membrane peptidoglycan carboxypeptidase
LVLFRPEPSKRRGVSTKTALVLGHILENTVKFGTGRYADTHVKMSGDEQQQERLDELDLSVPLFGKTGTANRYTNASFFGYLPLLNEEGNAMVIDGGYGVGVYVGYDNNKPMRRRATRVTGSLGALPAWTDIVNAIVSREDFAAGLDPVDLSFYGLAIERHDIGQENLAVAKSDGGRLIYPLQKVDPLDRYQPSIITFGARSPEGTFRPARSFAPFWLNQIPKRVDVVPSSVVASPEVAAPQP